MIWDTLLKQVDDPLWAKGIVLENGRQRFVLCTLDWCELCNESYADFCAVLAKAAGTTPDRVLVHCVHQHTAPYADRSAHRLLDQAPLPPPHLSQAFLDTLSARLAAAVREACGKLEPFDSVGLGEVKVERVASHRRLPDGKGGMTHPQPWVSASFTVGCWPPKILRQEEVLVLFTRLQVVRKEVA